MMLRPYSEADVSFDQETTSNRSLIIVVHAKGTPYQIKLLRARAHNLSSLSSSNLSCSVPKN